MVVGPAFLVIERARGELTSAVITIVKEIRVSYGQCGQIDIETSW
jgi:hypothetical protein